MDAFYNLYFFIFFILCPFNEYQGLESMYRLAQNCIQSKPMSIPHKLMGLLIGLLGENTEVSTLDHVQLVDVILLFVFSPSNSISSLFYDVDQVILAECSRAFGPW